MSSFNHISIPSKRNQPRGRWFTNMTKVLNSSRITGGKGILVSQTGSGVTISLAKQQPNTASGSPGVSGAVLAEIDGTSTGSGFTAKIFGNGYGHGATEIGNVHATDVALGSVINNSLGVIANRMYMDVISVTEEPDPEP